MNDGGPSSSSPGDVDRMKGPSFPQTLQTNWRRLSEITLCCSFLSSPCTRIWPSFLNNLENTLKNSFSSANTYFHAGLKRSRSLWTLSAYGALAAPPHWGFQDLSYADSSSRIWQSVTHTVEMWKSTQKDITILKEATAAQTPALQRIKAGYLLYVLAVCGAKAAVAWPYKHPGLVIRNEWKEKIKNNNQRYSHPSSTCQRGTHSPVVAGHRWADGLRSKGYGEVTCTACR